MRGVISPSVQWPDVPLKSESNRTPVPIPPELAIPLSVARKSGDGASRCPTSSGDLPGLIRSNSPCERLAQKCQVSREVSAFTIHGTASHRYSSLTASIGRPSRRGCATSAPRPRWTSTSGPTRTKPLPRRCDRDQDLVRTSCGIGLVSQTEKAQTPRNGASVAGLG